MSSAYRYAGMLPAILVGLGFCAMPASAQDGAPIEVLIGAASPGGAFVEVPLTLLNGTHVPLDRPLPVRLAARIDRGGQEEMIWLERAGTEESIRIPAGGFATVRYRWRAPVGDDQRPVLLSIPEWSSQSVALSLPARPVVAAPAEMAPPAPPETLPAEAATAPAAQEERDFLDNLSTHEPIYAVYGPGTNSDARLQLSFKYQLFGRRSRGAEPASWLDGLHVAYTQRMFWDLGAKSSPFRNIDFQPEIFYQVPTFRLAEYLTIDGQAGFRHESNGRAGLESRSFNTMFAQAISTWTLADGVYLEIGPRVWLFTGSRKDNPDIGRYRGHTGLHAAVGKENGLRLSTWSRLNPGSGKGAINAELSYPLDAVLKGMPDLYLFGQSFYGYGENLLDYNRRITRFRVGIGLAR